MQMRTKLAVHLAGQIVLLALAAAALWCLLRAYRALEGVQAHAQQAARLAAELRLNIDAQALVARLFVGEPQPRYAQTYREIERVRDGLAPRPADYGPGYWDRRLAGLAGLAAEPSVDRDPPMALAPRMREAGFDAEAMGLVDEALQCGKTLAALERQAMELAERGRAGEAPLQGRRALGLLQGETYLRVRADLAGLLTRLEAGLARQQRAAYREARATVRQASYLAAASLLVLAVHGWWAARRFARSVTRPLQALRAWAQSVRSGQSMERSAVRLSLPAQSEFSEVSAVIDEMAEAVEHSLAELREEVQRRTRAEEVVQHLANHDALTGLPSLRLLHDRLDRALASAQRDGKGVAVLFVDLNGFKPVNDRYGHESGDMVLKVVGQRLAGGVREADTVGRIGGDEFLVILPDVATLEAASQVRDKLESLVRQPIYLPVHKLVVQVSSAMGLALYPSMAQDAAGLLRLADQDMYARKAAGRSAPLPPIDVG